MTLKHYIENSGLKIGALEKKMGLQQSILSKVLRGERGLNKEKMALLKQIYYENKFQTLCKQLNKTPDEILEWIEENTEVPTTAKKPKLLL